MGAATDPHRAPDLSAAPASSAGDGRPGAQGIDDARLELARLADRALRLSGWDFCEVSLLDESGGRIIGVGLAGSLREHPPTITTGPLETFPAVSAILGAVPALVLPDLDDAESRHRYPIASEERLACAVGVALRLDDQLLGTLFAGSHSPRPISPDDVRQLIVVAEYTAATVLAERRAENTRREMRRLETLHALSAAVSHAESWEEMEARLSDALRRVAPFDEALVFAPNAEGVLCPFAGLGPSLGTLTLVRLREILDGADLRVLDLERDGDLLPACWRESLASRGATQCALGLATDTPTMLVVVALPSRAELKLDAADASMLRTALHQLGEGLRRVSLEQERREQEALRAAMAAQLPDAMLTVEGDDALVREPNGAALQLFPRLAAEGGTCTLEEAMADRAGKKVVEALRLAHQDRRPARLPAVRVVGVRPATWDIRLTPMTGSSGRRSVVLVSDVSERALAQQALEEALRLRAERESLLSGPEDAIMAVDRDGRIVHANEAAALLAGCSAEQLVGQNYVDVASQFATLEGARIPVEGMALWRVLETEAAARSIDFRSPHVPEHVFRAHAVPLRAPDGPLTGAVVWIRDVTPEIERERAREKLRYLEQERFAVLSLVSYGVVILDGDGRWLYANPEALRLLDLPADVDIRSLSAHDDRWQTLTLDGQSRPEQERTVLRALLHGERASVEYVYASAPDRKLRSTTVPVLDAAGAVIGAVHTVADITEEVRERGQRDDLVRRLAEREAFLNAMTDAVLVVDAQGVIRDCNRAFELARGRPRAELIGQSAFADRQGPGGTRLRPDTGEPIPDRQRATWRALHGESPATNEFRYAHAPERVWSSTSAAVRGADDALLGAVTVLRDVTERYEAQRRALEELELRARWQAFLREMPDGIVIHDAGGRVVDANDTFCQMMGTSREELIGLDAASPDTYHLDVEFNRCPAEAGALLRAVRGETVHNYEFRFATRPEQVYAASAAPVRDAAGGITGVVGIVRDVTEEVEARKRAVVAAQLERERATLLDSLPVVVAYIAPDGRIVDVNRAYEEMTGTKASDLIGRHVTAVRVCWPDGRPVAEHERLDLRVLQGAADAESFEFCFVDQPDRVVQGAVRAIPDAGGALSGIVLVLSDVTEQHEARRRLVEQLQAEQERAILLEHIPAGYIRFAADGRVTDVNREWERITGLSPADVRGLSALDVAISYADGRPVPEDEQPSARVLRGERVEGFSFVMPRLPGRLLETRGQPLYSAEGSIEGGVLILRDVTAERERERRLLETLRLKEERASLLDALPVGFLLFDRSSTVVACNRAVEGIMGKRTEELLGLELGDLAPHLWLDGTPAHPEELLHVRALRGERVDGALVRLASRSDRVARVHARPLFGSDAEVRAAIVLIEDFTEQFEARRRLEEHARLLQERGALLDSLPVGVVVFDAQARIVEANRAAEEITGFSLQAMRGAKATVPTTDSAGHDNPPERSIPLLVLAGQDVDRVRFRLPARPDRVLRGSGRALRDAGGTIVGGLMLLEDATAEYEARRRGREYARLHSEHAALFDSLPLGVVVFDEGGWLVDCNRAATEILGSEREALIGRRAGDDPMLAADGTPLPREARPTTAVVERGEAVHGAVFRLPYDPSRLFVAFGQPLHNAAGEPAGGVIVFSDITEIQRQQD